MHLGIEDVRNSPSRAENDTNRFRPCGVHQLFAISGITDGVRKRPGIGQNDFWFFPMLSLDRSFYFLETSDRPNQGNCLNPIRMPGGRLLAPPMAENSPDHFLLIFDRGDEEVTLCPERS